MTIPPHLIHHEVLLILQLAKDHGEKRKELGQLENVRILRKISIEDLIIRSVQVVAFEDIDDLEHKDAARFGVNSLLLDLVA